MNSGPAPYQKSGEQAVRPVAGSGIAGMLTPEALEHRAREVQSRGQSLSRFGVAGGLSCLVLGVGLGIQSVRTFDGTTEGMVASNFLATGAVAAMGCAYVGYMALMGGRRLAETADALRARAQHGRSLQEHGR
ncbi:MAG: hypothetical protein KF754_01220 [Planctomycetes bacterium]|nr:hypothetical protein [Planctomycetota bacterium]